jgi:hypothetical protein
MPFGMDIYFFFCFFSIARTSFWHMKNFRERLMINEWCNLFGGRKTCFCITLSVRVSSFIMGVCVSWSWVHDENLNKGHNNLTKLNMIISSIWLRFCIYRTCHMALVGSTNQWGTFKIFILNIKTPDVKPFIEQSHNKFSLHHIISRNNLDPIKYLQPTSFKFLGWDISNQ